MSDSSTTATSQTIPTPLQAMMIECYLTLRSSTRQTQMTVIRYCSARPNHHQSRLATTRVISTGQMDLREPYWYYVGEIFDKKERKAIVRARYDVDIQVLSKSPRRKARRMFKSINLSIKLTEEVVSCFHGYLGHEYKQSMLNKRAKYRRITTFKTEVSPRRSTTEG